MKLLFIKKTFLLLLLSFLFSLPIKPQINLNYKNSNIIQTNKFYYQNHSSIRSFSKLYRNNSVGLSALAIKYPPGPNLTLFDGLGKNILNSFKGDNLYLHLAGVASTFLIVSSNTDYHVQKFFNEHGEYGNLARPVIRFALYFPFVISGSLYTYGKLNKDEQAVGASFAVLQSTLIAFMYNSLLKALTGRPHPDWSNNHDMESLSKSFRFGFLRGGIFWGWPSGHTSSTIAVVSALSNFYPEKTWLKIAGYSYAAYMIFAVSSLNRGGMHWFSDAVAAAFMSYAIGSTVGKFYRDRFKNSPATSSEKLNSNIPIFSVSFKL